MIDLLLLFKDCEAAGFQCVDGMEFQGVGFRVSGRGVRVSG